MKSPDTRVLVIDEHLKLGAGIPSGWWSGIRISTSTRRQHMVPSAVFEGDRGLSQCGCSIIEAMKECKDRHQQTFDA